MKNLKTYKQLFERVLIKNNAEEIITQIEKDFDTEVKIKTVYDQDNVYDIELHDYDTVIQFLYSENHDDYDDGFSIYDEDGIMFLINSYDINKIESELYNLLFKLAINNESINDIIKISKTKFFDIKKIEYDIKNHLSSVSYTSDEMLETLIEIGIDWTLKINKITFYEYFKYFDIKKKYPKQYKKYLKDTQIKKFKI